MSLQTPSIFQADPLRPPFMRPSGPLIAIRNNLGENAGSPIFPIYMPSVEARMNRFCDNPECELHELKTDAFSIVIKKRGKETVECERHSFALDDGGNLHFCDVCYSAVQMVKRGKYAENTKERGATV
jgi:hypothetical protein